MLAGVTLGLVVTYLLGAEALLRSPYAEPAHNLFMSLIRGGGHESMSQLHGGPAGGKSMEEKMSESKMQNMNQSAIANNILGSPTGLAAGGLAAVTVMGVVPLAAASFVVSWKQRSFVVAGLLAVSGLILMMLPLSNMNFGFPGPTIGVIAGLGILGLGLAKATSTAKAMRVAPP